MILTQKADKWTNMVKIRISLYPEPGTVGIDYFKKKIIARVERLYLPLIVVFCRDSHRRRPWINQQRDKTIPWFIIEFFLPIIKCGLMNAFVGAKGCDSEPSLFLSFDELQNFWFVYHLKIVWLKIHSQNYRRKMYYAGCLHWKAVRELQEAPKEIQWLLDILGKS